jgi:hypothetical protein
LTPESKVKAKLRRLLNGYHCWTYWPVPGGYGRRTVDVLGLYRGHFFAVEAKRPGKGATVLQDNEMEAIREAGGTTFLVNDDASLKQLENWLESRNWRLT